LALASNPDVQKKIKTPQFTSQQALNPVFKYLQEKIAKKWAS
jgi:hypothetical protein